jgi:AAA+ superfamily predicted ATPase
MDLVRGKGKGLIILLHGVPRVGKTSTAESVASFTKRPLYPITCGDLGETARDVEESLEAHFTLAHRWGCILLLDEADVFLAKRERGDIKRNALVSGELCDVFIGDNNRLTGTH